MSPDLPTRSFEFPHPRSLGFDDLLKLRQALIDWGVACIGEDIRRETGKMLGE